MNTRQRFGARIANLRQDKNWSQEFLSEKTGIGVTHISRIENGRKEACLDRMELLARSFGMTLSELLKDI